MKKRWLTLWALIGVGFVLLTSSAIAIQSVLSLRDEALHCGESPNLNLYEGLIAALDKSEHIASETKLRENRPDLQLELVMHFPERDTSVPETCKAKLLAISEAVKAGNMGDLVIRSSTRAEGSTEFDLAVASGRLESIKQFFRDDRLAVKALVLELHPFPSSVLLEKSIDNPRIVEIYSGSLR